METVDDRIVRIFTFQPVYGMQRKSGSKIYQESAVSAVGTGLSRVFGMVRDIVIGHVFGAGRNSDAFWMAWTVPGLFRRFVADEGLTGALIPAIAQAEREDSEGRARSLANCTFVALLTVSVLICFGGFFCAPWLVQVIAPGFADDPTEFELTVTLTRWLFPFIAFVSLVSYCEGLLNYRGHFFIPKLAPGIVSCCIAASAFLLANDFERPIFALAIGALVGGLAHLVVCIPPLIKKWGVPALEVRGMLDRRFRSFLSEMGKVAVIGLIAQLNVVLLRILASYLEEGAMTHYWYANRLVDFSQGTVAVAVGSALLPAIARDAAERNWNGFHDSFSRAVRLSALVLIPAACLLAGLARPMVAMLFLHGKFVAEDVGRTASTLQCLVPFMIALGGINIIKKAYFALNDRTTLLAVGSCGLVFTAGSGYVLSTRIGVEGLGLALSISATAQLVIYFSILCKKRREGLNLGSLARPLLKMLFSAVPATAAAMWICRFGEWGLGWTLTTNWLVFFGAGALGLVLYVLLATLLGVEELHWFMKRLQRG